MAHSKLEQYIDLQHLKILPILAVTGSWRKKMQKRSICPLLLHLEPNFQVKFESWTKLGYENWYEGYKHEILEIDQNIANLVLEQLSKLTNRANF